MRAKFGVLGLVLLVVAGLVAVPAPVSAVRSPVIFDTMANLYAIWYEDVMQRNEKALEILKNVTVEGNTVVLPGNATAPAKIYNLTMQSIETELELAKMYRELGQNTFGYAKYIWNRLAYLRARTAMITAMNFLAEAYDKPEYKVDTECPPALIKLKEMFDKLISEI
ncbi:hypothetical protein [Pyrococcus kukulkanii]|uniref:hypothetical protein n=1 Tax=Pyrococcus kukulkanii TaxID=1609559 RepID=UPI0035634108